MTLTTHSGVEIHSTPAWGNRVSLPVWVGKPLGSIHRKTMFYDLRRYRRWLIA